MYIHLIIDVLLVVIVYLRSSIYGEYKKYYYDFKSDEIKLSRIQFFKDRYAIILFIPVFNVVAILILLIDFILKDKESIKKYRVKTYITSLNAKVEHHESEYNKFYKRKQNNSDLNEKILSYFESLKRISVKKTDDGEIYYYKLLSNEEKHYFYEKKFNILNKIYKIKTMDDEFIKEMSEMFSKDKKYIDYIIENRYVEYLKENESANIEKIIKIKLEDYKEFKEFIYEIEELKNEDNTIEIKHKITKLIVKYDSLNKDLFLKKINQNEFNKRNDNLIKNYLILKKEIEDINNYLDYIEIEKIKIIK